MSCCTPGLRCCHRAAPVHRRSCGRRHVRLSAAHVAHRQLTMSRAAASAARRLRPARARCRRRSPSRRSRPSSRRRAGAAPSRRRCSRPSVPASSSKRDRPCRHDGHEVSTFTSPSKPSARSAAAPLRISSSLRKRTCVEMSGRVTASVPDSPQQRSFSATSAPISAFTTFERLRRSSSACGRGRGTCSARRSTPSSCTPFSIRYSWMSSSRQPGKILSNSYFCSWSMHVPHDTITVLMSR